MSEPLVCAIMLTKDRPAMAARAVRAFREQTYKNAQLFVLDTGAKCAPGTPKGEMLAKTVWMPEQGQLNRSIGTLRNGAIRCALIYFTFDIIIHFDDGDFSHPNRIAEQVAHLQSSGADVVGYSELLFWRTPPPGQAQWTRESFPHVPAPPKMPSVGEAWLYHNVRADLCPGTSLAYWRKTWERKPFLDTSEAEDRKFCMGLNCAAASGIPRTVYQKDSPGSLPEPRLIASIHGGNTADYDIEGIIARGGGNNWRRVPEWDVYCCERMKL